VINVPADYASIQDAVGAAASGDIVLVAPGDYYENVVGLGDGVTLQGSGPDQTVLHGQIHYQGADSATVTGFTVTSAGASGMTVGAGIFVLVGKIAEIAGPAAPLAFLIAALLAGLTALSFGELAARYPVSAGEAAYVQAGLRSKRLAATVGLLVIIAGTVSSAAIVNGFVGYF